MKDEYLTVEEFAALPSDAQNAVWSADIDVIPAVPAIPNGIRRYHRAQVQALLAETAAK